MAGLQISVNSKNEIFPASLKRKTEIQNEKYDISHLNNINNLLYLYFIFIY